MAGEDGEESNRGSSSSKKRCFVAVHVGAGYHSPSNEKAFHLAMKRACFAAASILQKVPFLSPPSGIIPFSGNIL
jgi:hypothetical protein